MLLVTNPLPFAAQVWKAAAAAARLSAAVEAYRIAEAKAMVSAEAIAAVLAAAGATEESVAAALGAAEEGAMTQLVTNLPSEVLARLTRVFPLPGSQGVKLKEGDEVCTLSTADVAHAAADDLLFVML